MILTGRGGRVWVVVSMPGIEVDNPNFDPAVEGSQRTVWREPTAFDVFESDGTYLGRVVASSEFRAFPHPVMRGDEVWATTADELGVTRVVRYRINIDEPS